MRENLRGEAGNLKARATALLVLSLAACKTAQTPSTFDYGAVLGVAVETADRACLAIRNASLTAGQRIQFVTSTTPQATGEAEITRKVEQACTPVEQDRPGLSHYEFKVVRGSLPKGAPAFAIANSSRTLAAAETGVTGDLDGDGQLESFRACTSSEGVHLTVWSGKPLEGRRHWHSYHYLGYDVEANCTEGDTKPDTR